MLEITTCFHHVVELSCFSGDQTIVVRTECGNYSFPKGKRTKEETHIVKAWRKTTASGNLELREETGLTPSDVKLLEDVHFDKYTEKGNLSVGYLTKDKHIFTFDRTELAYVDWYSVNDIIKLDKLKESLKQILMQAYQIYTQRI